MWEPPQYQIGDDADNFRRPAARALITLPRAAVTPLILAGLILVSLALYWWRVGLSDIDLIHGAYILLALLLIPLGYDLACRLLNRPAGLLFAALLAAGIPFVAELTPALGEVPLICSLGAHLWLLVGWRDSYRERGRSWPWLAAAGAALAVAALLRWPALYAAALALGLMAAELWLRQTGRRLTTTRFVPTRDHTQFVGVRPSDRFADPSDARRRAWPIGRWLWAVGLSTLIFLIPLALTIALWAFRSYLATSLGGIL